MFLFIYLMMFLFIPPKILMQRQLTAHEILGDPVTSDASRDETHLERSPVVCVDDERLEEVEDRSRRLKRHRICTSSNLHGARALV